MEGSPEQEQDYFGGLDINPEFIEENKKMITNLGKLRQKSKPHNKSEIAKRRKEVYRLHFESGLPVAAIADQMKVDKNTIRNDIFVLYREIGKDREGINFEDNYAKQVDRLEAQRARLLSYLKKAGEIDQQLAIERMVADIDLKLLASATRMEYNRTAFWDAVRKTINKWAAEEKIDDLRVTQLFELVRISEKTRKNIDKITRETWER